MFWMDLSFQIEGEMYLLGREEERDVAFICYKANT